jgi:hypothetical protein
VGTAACGAESGVTASHAAVEVSIGEVQCSLHIDIKWNDQARPEAM